MPEAVEQPAIRSRFVSRVASLPSVVTALETANSVYKGLKDRNGIINQTLTTVESSATFAVGRTAPLLDKFSGPIQYVDGVACKGLDKIEQKIPLIKETPAQVWTNVKSFFGSKFESVKGLVSKVPLVSMVVDGLTNKAQSYNQWIQEKIKSVLEIPLVQELLKDNETENNKSWPRKSLVVLKNGYNLALRYLKTNSDSLPLPAFLRSRLSGLTSRNPPLKAEQNGQSSITS